MFRVLLLLAGLVLCSVPAHAFQKVLDTNLLLRPAGQNEPDWIDLEGDGLQDLYSVQRLAHNLFQIDIVKLNLTIPWSCTIDAHALDLTDPTIDSWRILGIDDFDSSPGREALMMHLGDPPYGFILVSIQSETILWEWPSEGGDLVSTRLADLTGDGRKEFVLVMSYLGLYRTQVWSYGSLAGATDPGESPPASHARAVPNPSSGTSQIRFDLPAAGPVSVGIVDVQGRIVRSLMEGVREAGPIALHWDGRDDLGRNLPGGVYFARIQTAEETHSSKVVLTR